jgi:3-dehydroquinate synthase
MEDTLLPLRVKSNLNDYIITFHNSVEKLLHTLDKTNWFIIDENLNLYYNFDNIPNKIYYKCTEASKSFESIHILLNQFVENKFKANTEVVIIGGGTLQDVAGFCCSIYSRGIKYRLVPTTLLAQCDSCVGGKTSINYSSTKNLLGTFYPPVEILICDKFLETLTDSDYKSGLGEVFKFKILQGKPVSEIHNKHNLNSTVRECLAYKISVIEVDEFDKSLRKLLNYGHTFGHALEITSQYSIPHGSAVIFGILIVNDIMEKLDEGSMIDTKSIAEAGKELVAHIELQKSWFDINKLVKIIKADKKNTGQINLVFPDSSTIFKLITLEEDEIIRLCDSVFTRFL